MWPLCWSISQSHINSADTSLPFPPSASTCTASIRSRGLKSNLSTLKLALGQLRRPPSLYFFSTCRRQSRELQCLHLAFSCTSGRHQAPWRAPHCIDFPGHLLLPLRFQSHHTLGQILVLLSLSVLPTMHALSLVICRLVANHVGLVFAS